MRRQKKTKLLLFAVILNVSVAYVCVSSLQSSFSFHFSFPHHFQNDYHCSRFYQVWQTHHCFIFRAVCPEILAQCPLDHKANWTDVSDTSCDASPTDSVCRIRCERLNWDSCLLLLELPEKLVPLFQTSLKIPSLLKAGHTDWWCNRVFVLFVKLAGVGVIRNLTVMWKEQSRVTTIFKTC